MSFIRKPVLLLFTMVLMVLTAACGSATESKSETQQTPAPAAGASTTPTVKSIKHSLGTTEVKGTPKRIVALEWVYAEDLLALGIQPVGVADIKGYQKNVNVSTALDAGVADVGTRQEPNLEAIAALKPDLILAPDFRIKASYEALNKIAPTIAFNPYPAEGAGNQYEGMETTFKTIADLTGKQAEADKVLADLQKTYADAKQKLKAGGKEGASIVVTQAFTQQNAAVLRLFTDNSMLVQILERAGLKNVYKADKFEAYGFATGSVESLPAVQSANFIYIVQDNDNVFQNQLKDNPVWNGLAFVKEKRTYKLPGNTWTFGGPLSAKVLVETATKALLP